MRINQVLLAGAAALALAGPAEAGHFKGWYLGIEGGANWIGDEDALYTRTFDGALDTSDTAEASFDTGWAILATAGYAFASHWRIEGEFGYRSNDISAVFAVSDSFRPFTGEVDEYSLMANVLYDASLGERLSLSLGAGAGGDRVKLDAQLGSGVFSDDEWNFAAQGIAGLSYALSPRLDLTLTYRYLRVFDPAFSEAGFVSVFTTTDTIAFDGFSKHSVTVGLRFDLFPDEAPVAMAPPPPPPPPAPPPVAKQFIVFFGFDKCNITPEADNVLSEAATAAKSTGAAVVKIVGHTDTSGSNVYNQRLSDCRANAARTNLASKGIPDGAISTSGRGETELMVQTGDGVKEPQNRRATVDLQ